MTKISLLCSNVLIRVPVVTLLRSLSFGSFLISGSGLPARHSLSDGGDSGFLSGSYHIESPCRPACAGCEGCWLGSLTSRSRYRGSLERADLDPCDPRLVVPLTPRALARAARAIWPCRPSGAFFFWKGRGIDTRNHSNHNSVDDFFRPGYEKVITAVSRGIPPPTFGSSLILRSPGHHR